MPDTCLKGPILLIFALKVSRLLLINGCKFLSILDAKISALTVIGPLVFIFKVILSTIQFEIIPSLNETRVNVAFLVDETGSC
jgi:hypothetical protein